MNKKVYLGMFAAATMLLATSCSNDELDTVLSGNEATVSFSLGVEGGVQTRAISDGTGANYLVYSVYDAQSNLITTIAGSTKGRLEKTDAFTELKETVNLTLAKGQTYTVVFWAQNKLCTAYNTDDLTKVTINYTGNNNDESRDAFFATETFEVTGDATIDVDMKRPFSQLNVGVTKADWDEAVNSTVTITKSSVKVKGVANTIDLRTGKASVTNETDGATDATLEIEYTQGDIPSAAEPLTVDVNRDGKIATDESESFHWISMSYLLVNDASEDGAAKALVDVEFTFYPKSSDRQNIVLADLNNIPVQRNYRTNILGKFLTGDQTYNIVISPAYTNNLLNKDPYSPESVLERNLADPEVSEITFTEDLDFGTSYLTVTHDVTIDMANHALTAGGLSSKNYGTVVENCSLTINNANIKNGGVYVNNGTLIYNNGSANINDTNKRYAFYAGNNSTIIIYDGEFTVEKNTNGRYVAAVDNSTVYIKGGTWNGASSNYIYIGTGGQVVITGGTFNFNPSSYVVASQYDVTEDTENKTWTVSVKASTEPSEEPVQ